VLRLDRHVPPGYIPNVNMHLNIQTYEVSLIPYQMTTFEEQERWLSERTSRVSAQLESAFSGPGVGPFGDNTLTSDWYHTHQDNFNRDIHFSDGSSDESPRVPSQRSSFRKRLSSSRLPSTTTLSSSSVTSPSRPSPSKATFRQKNTSSPFVSSGHWTRKRLQAQWDKATQETGSASVTIINEVDGEEVPGVPEDFQYLEHGYDWGRYAPDRNFLIGCDCVGNCSGANTDGCCIKNIDSDPEGLTGFWYDKRGLFRLANAHILLRECNVNCSCDATCRTRVAQKPRKIPLQVFKTPNCGWGVRPAVRVQKGALIGLYSGVLLHRKRWEADKLQGERKNYIFDLDHNIFGEEGPIQNQYSVDGYTKGNWGRFINHSCDPNMQVLPAMFDSPQIEKSYLVFVAIRDIREREELTIDYHPNLGLPAKGKGKRKRRWSDACMCDAKLCRGVRP